MQAEDGKILKICKSFEEMLQKKLDSCIDQKSRLENNSEAVEEKTNETRNNLLIIN